MDMTNLEKCRNIASDLEKHVGIVHELVKVLLKLDRPFIVGFSEDLNDEGLPAEIYVHRRNASGGNIIVYSKKEVDYGNKE